jgi:hypothetical protein
VVDSQPQLYPTRIAYLYFLPYKRCERVSTGTLTEDGTLVYSCREQYQVLAYSVCYTNYRNMLTYNILLQGVAVV